PRHAPLRVLLLFLSSLLRPLPFLPPSPTRRSSDLGQAVAGATFPVPIWHLYMAAAEWRKPARQFLEPTHEISYTPLEKHYYGYRSEEHTSELQSLTNLVCRLLLEKKTTTATHESTT